METQKIVAIILSLIIIFAIVGSLYIDYKHEVGICCDGYRTYILDGQLEGECSHWSFTEHLKGINGCAIPNLKTQPIEVQKR